MGLELEIEDLAVYLQVPLRLLNVTDLGICLPQKVVAFTVGRVDFD